jgi:PAS domain S-box-containing protein
MGDVIAAARASAALLPIGVIVTDPNGTCVHVDGRWCELSGVSLTESVGQGWSGDLARLHEWLALSNPRPSYSLEYRSTSPDGLVQWARGWLAPVTNDVGEVVAYVGSILDVTDLARSEVRQRQIAEDPSNAIVRVDRTGTVSYVSPVFGMLGQPGAEHVGAPMTLHIHPDDLHLFADRDALFDNPDEMRFRRFRLISRTGGIVWVDGCSHGAVDPITGRVNEIQTSLRDVTEQVEAEQALRESEERFRVLAEAAVEGICLSDSGGIISANPAFSELYGYEPDEVVGMSISAFMTPEHHCAAAEAHALDSALRVEFTAVRKDGSRFPGYASSRTTTYQGRTVRVTTITDLTALKLSSALEERRRIARDLHDGLAQELAFIASKTRTATRHQPTAETLEAVGSAADRALHEARRAISVLSSREPQPLPRALCQTAEDLCSRSGVGVALLVDEDVRVAGDAGEDLLRILREAITNASRHGRAEKITVRLWQDEHVHLTVEDDGTGFDPGAPSRGFGLVSMRERAQAVGATFALESRVGEGTRVEVVL